MGQAMTLKVEDQGIAHLILDLQGEKVNKLSSSVLEELESCIQELRSKPEIRALLITSAKPDIFVAGADIHELGAIQTKEEVRSISRRGHTVFQQLATLPFPSVALIDGACLGGGMELALACSYRITTDNPKTQLGLPEVRLGIIPGWGGTQRLPRLVGLTQGLNMLLNGKAIDGKKAWKIHLADAWVPSEFAEERAEKFVREILTKKGRREVHKSRGQRPWLDLLMESFIGRPLVFWQTKKSVEAKTKGQYPAPLAIIQLLKETFSKKLEDGLEAEAQAIGSVLDTAVARNLFRLYLMSEELKKDPGAELSVGAELKEIKQTAVLGAGTMGAGIAWLFSYKGYSVRLRDMDWPSVGKGFQAISKIYQQLVKIRKLKPRELALSMHRVSGCVDYSGFQRVDIVVEAIVENLAVKRQVLEELEAVVPRETILCTNTSSLSIAEMAQGMKYPERFVGLHFFNPVNRMPLVEVVAGEQTSAETVATAVQFMRDLGKTPIVVQDCSGFLVNRILVPSLHEAGRLFEEGVPISRIDKLSESFGMPMGPFRLTDEVGIDVAIKASTRLQDAYGARMRMPGVFEKVAQEGLLGKKVQKGFYIYEGAKGCLNPAVESLVQVGKSREAGVSDEEIMDRITLIMINEASRCLEEGICKSPKQVDMGLLMGAGFPPFRGGLLRYADKMGIPTVVSKLDTLAKKYGERFVPSQLLQEMQKERKCFHK